MRLYLLLLLPGLLTASTTAQEIPVATDVTAAGQAVSVPGGKSPVNYVAVAGGFQEFGAVIAGEKTPVRATVEWVLAQPGGLVRAKQSDW